MSFFTRLLVGGGLAVVGAAVGGPAGAYAGWKTGGFLATGNPLHLVPGGSGVADGMDIASGLSDAGSFADGAGPDVYGNPSNTDIHGNSPSDIHGNETGRLGNGNMPADGWGRKA